MHRRKDKKERNECIDGRGSRKRKAMVNIYQPISRPYVEEAAEQRVAAPLIDLHKIAVSWLRFLSSRASKNERMDERGKGRDAHGPI